MVHWTGFYHNQFPTRMCNSQLLGPLFADGSSMGGGSTIESGKTSGLGASLAGDGTEDGRLGTNPIGDGLGTNPIGDGKEGGGLGTKPMGDGT